MYISVISLVRFENLPLSLCLSFFLCIVGMLDALWNAHSLNRISVPEYFIEGLDVTTCASYLYPFIKVVHRKTKKSKNRGTQKFKIIGVKVCTVSMK